MSKDKSDESSKVDRKEAKKVDALEAEISELRTQLEEARAKADEYLDLARRTQADAENFRKRKEKEVEEFRRFASLDLVKELLNVADDLGRALEKADSADPVVAGVMGVKSNMDKILANQGVKEIPTDGKFDPNVHEALAIVEAEEEGMIAMTAQKGYTMNDRVIRYAKVVVTKKKEEPAAPAPEEGPAESN